jgi:hypothetical protein
MPREHAAAIEISIQQVHAASRVHGEWFALHPLTALQLIQLSLATAFIHLGGADPALVPDVIRQYTWCLDENATDILGYNKDAADG